MHHTNIAGNDLNPLTMNEIVAQSFITLLAGYEGSSGTASFALFQLSTHLQIQEKVREELRSVLKKYNNKICFDALQELEYMQQVIDGNLNIYDILYLIVNYLLFQRFFVYIQVFHLLPEHAIVNIKYLKPT